MSGHTPGPWKLARDASGDIHTDQGSDWLFAPDGRPIIHFDKGDYDSEADIGFSDADAILIAAAPDLLDACNVAIGHMTGGMDGDWRDCDPVEILRAAIIKATQ